MKRAPALVVAQANKWTQKEAGAEKKKRTYQLWSTKTLGEVASRQECENTEEVVQWRSIKQEGINDLWKDLCERVERKVLEKFQERRGQERYVQGRGEPRECLFVKKEKETSTSQVGEACWAGNFSWFREEYSLQRKKGVQAGETEEEDIKQQQRMEIMAGMMKKIKANDRMDAKAVVGSVNCLLLIVKKRGSTQNGRIRCSNGIIGCVKRRRRGSKARRGASEAGRPNYFQCRRRSRFIAKNRITKPTGWRGGVQVQEEWEDDAKPMTRCEEEGEEWAKHWQAWEE